MEMILKNKPEKCERCGEVLIRKNIIWLEFSNTDGNYYMPESFPESHESQGCFPFGSHCAKKVVILKNKQK